MPEIIISWRASTMGGFVSFVRAVLLLLALAPLAASVQAEVPESSALLAALRGGGCVVVVRHGATNADQDDTDPLHVDQPGNEAKQRQLSDKGRADARAWRAAFAKIGIPVGQVYSSHFARARETARLAFGEPAPTFDLTDGGRLVSREETNRRAAALKKMAATPPQAGTNTLLVTHKQNVIDAFGRDWLDVKEGEASVFRPDGQGGTRLIGRVGSEQWTELAAATAN
jgi:broad specificity phosphatase PhoE